MALSLEEAVDSFCCGFCYTRSYTHPYECIKVGILRVMRDAPRRSGDVRNTEIVVIDADPDEVCASIRKLQPTRFYLCAVDPNGADPAATKAAYKARNFRMLRSEPLFICDVDGVAGAPDPRVRRITDQEGADLVKVAAGSPQILKRDLHDGNADLRLFVAFEAKEPIGWVKSIRTGPETAWVSNLYVHPDHRRKGLGAALMSTMLLDDREYGIRWSVLLASTEGAKLYPRVGYKRVALLQLFAPLKEEWGIPTRR